MKSSVIALAATAAGTAYAAELAGAYSQCGGTNWTGPTACASGYYCQSQNPYYYQCTYGSATATGASEATSAASSVATSTLVTKASTSAAAVASSSQTSIPTTKAVIVSTSAAVVSTSAAPSTSAVASSSAAPSSSAVATSSAAPSSSAVATGSAAASSSAAKTSSAASSTSTGKVKYAGVNISGFDFGCSTDGTCTVSGVTDPSTNGVDQMKHFVTDDGLNAFRLPVGWQYLVNNDLGGTLDSTNLAAYDSLVSSCVDVADLCIISIHNYARWNGNIIGQSSGSVTNAQFTSLWSQLATKYASETKVAFAIMNEPHDVPDVTTWSATVQEAVTAIRKAGATDNLVLLPGNDWTHASTLISDGSAAALNTITNIDGSTDKLIFDVHQYLDSDGSGTSTTCTTNNADTFETLGAWLRTEGRQAMLTETGGSSDSTCLSNVCEELAVLMKYSDVFLGWTGWAAGAFATSYALSETPSGSAGSFTDQEIVSQCIAGVFNGKTTSK